MKKKDSKKTGAKTYAVKTVGDLKKYINGIDDNVRIEEICLRQVKPHWFDVTISLNDVCLNAIDEDDAIEQLEEIFSKSKFAQLTKTWEIYNVEMLDPTGSNDKD